MQNFDFRRERARSVFSPLQKVCLAKSGGRYHVQKPKRVNRFFRNLGSHLISWSLTKNIDKI